MAAMASEPAVMMATVKSSLYLRSERRDSEQSTHSDGSDIQEGEIVGGNNGRRRSSLFRMFNMFEGKTRRASADTTNRPTRPRKASLPEGKQRFKLSYVLQPWKWRSKPATQTLAPIATGESFFFWSAFLISPLGGVARESCGGGTMSTGKRGWKWGGGCKW